MEEGRHTFGASDCKSIIPHHNRPSHNRTPWHATTTQDISWYDFRAVKASYFSDILRAILNSRSSSPLHDPPTLKVVLIGVDTRKMRTLVESFVRASEGEFIATRWVSSVWTRRHNNCLRAAPLAFASVVSRGAIRQDDLVLAPPSPSTYSSLRHRARIVYTGTPTPASWVGIFRTPPHIRSSPDSTLQDNMSHSEDSSYPLPRLIISPLPHRLLPRLKFPHPLLLHPISPADARSSAHS